MFTKEEIALAKPLVEAIKTLAERQEKMCPECKGRRKIGSMLNPLPYPHSQSTVVECDNCNNTGKVKGNWEWEPEPGEWCINKEGGYAQLISGIDKKTGDLYLTSRVINIWLHSVNFIPLLHWERIREIMLSLDFKLYFRNPLEGATVAFAKLKELECDKDIIEEMYRDEHIPSNFWHHASSFQLATMQAVIGLAKEANHG